MNTEEVDEALKAGRVWFTSDTHFGHKNIIKYCDRPFDDTDQMDEIIIERWNATVPENGIVFHLGDVAMGDITKSLPKVGRLNGYKILVTGNHDRTFVKYGEAKTAQWFPEYEKYFQMVVDEKGMGHVIDGVTFRLSHFPYTGDHTPDDRHSDVRPVDDGMPLIHGHTHSTDRVTLSIKGTHQIHVGVDAWDFTPVSFEQIKEAMEV